MQSIEDLFAAVRQFKLFSQVQPILLNLNNSLKSKVWTLEILTRHLNEIIEKFLSSDFDHIEAFFFSFLTEKFGKDSLAKQKFCYTLLMSIYMFEEKHKYIKLYAKLLGTESDYAVFHCFWELKDIILDIKGVLNRKFANLDHLYLSEKHWQLLLNSFLGYNFDQIFEFRKHMQAKIQNIKREGKPERILEFTRNDEYCASFFIKEVLARFHEAHILEKYRTNVFESYAGPALDRKTTLERGQYNSMIDRMSKMRNTRMSGLNHFDVNSSELVNAKNLEKERLIAEIKQTTQLANTYKQSAIKVAGYIEQIDPILVEYQQTVKKTAEAMQDIKARSLAGPNLNEFKSQVSDIDMDLMETGSSINVKNAKKLKRSLLNTESKMYKKFEERLKDNRPTLKKLIRNLKATIFCQGFDIANDSQTKEMETLKEKINKLFGHFTTLENSQVLIVDTFFQNINQENEPKVTDLLFNVSEKIEKTLKKELNEEDKQDAPIDEEQLEEAIRESFKADLERYETLRKETAPWQENIDPEFRKNRYSTKPLNEQASNPTRESLLGVEVPTSDGSFKPAFLNFSKNKATENVDYENADNSLPPKSSTGHAPNNSPNDNNDNHTSVHLGAEVPLYNRDSNLHSVKDQLQQPLQRMSNHPTSLIEKAKANPNISIRPSNIPVSSNSDPKETNFKKKSPENEPVVIEAKTINRHKDSTSGKSYCESDIVIKPLQTSGPNNNNAKQQGAIFNVVSQPSQKKVDPSLKTIPISQTSIQITEDPPFETKITAINKIRANTERRDSDLSLDDKQDIIEDPPNERPSLRLTISRLSKVGSDRGSIKRVSVKKELSEIALPRNQSVLDPIPEFLTKSDVEEPKDKGQKNDGASSKYNSNVPLMKSKEGVMFAQEIGLIDEQPKTIKNFFSNFWGKK